MADQRYVTLMASLPYHGTLFGARQTPLSRFQLDKRLAWLEPDDAATLASIETLLRWGRNLLADTDEKFLERAKGVMADLDNKLLADYVTTRLETRTFIAALRKRALGHVAPSSSERWGYGRWQRVMQNHWNELTFFLREPGAPLDNNLCEQALKKAILHRKNYLFYKTKHGAYVGDLFMSLIHTCILCKVNPFDYLTQLQKHSSLLFKNPGKWLPWNYKESIQSAE